jgi:hypothetical protein
LGHRRCDLLVVGFLEVHPDHALLPPEVSEEGVGTAVEQLQASLKRKKEEVKEFLFF